MRQGADGDPDPAHPLFARYQVDLAIQGHNHVYERTNPLIYDPVTNSARSSKQAVALSPAEPAEVEPAKDGTTYVVAGTAGTPRYGWSGPGETDRNFAAGAGKSRWRVTTADAVGAPAARGGLVAVPFAHQNLALLDGLSGRELARVRATDEAIHRDYLVVD